MNKLTVVFTKENGEVSIFKNVQHLKMNNGVICIENINNPNGVFVCNYETMEQFIEDDSDEDYWEE